MTEAGIPISVCAYHWIELASHPDERDKHAQEFWNKDWEQVKSEYRAAKVEREDG